MSKIFCIAAEFDTPEALIAACEKTRDAGYKKFESYTPFPVHGLADAMGLKRPILPWVIFGGGLVEVTRMPSCAVATTTSRVSDVKLIL